MIEDIAEINATTVQTMAVYESFENNDRTMTMNLDEDTDKGGENARRFKIFKILSLFLWHQKPFWKRGDNANEC